MCWKNIGTAGDDTFWTCRWGRVTRCYFFPSTKKRSLAKSHPKKNHIQHQNSLHALFCYLWRRRWRGDVYFPLQSIEVGASEERGVARNQTVPAGNPRGDLVTAREKKIYKAVGVLNVLFGHAGLWSRRGGCLEPFLMVFFRPVSVL